MSVVVFEPDFLEGKILILGVHANGLIGLCSQDEERRNERYFEDVAW